MAEINLSLDCGKNFISSVRAIELSLQNSANKITDDVRELSFNLFNSKSFEQRESLIQGAKRLNLAYKQCFVSRFNRATHNLNEANKDYPYSSTSKVIEVLIEFFNLLKNGKDVDHLIHDSRVQLAIELNNDAAYALRADIKRYCMDLQGAREDVETALRMNPKNIHALEIRADLARSVKDMKQAAKDSVKARELELAQADIILEDEGVSVKDDLSDIDSEPPRFDDSYIGHPMIKKENTLADDSFEGFLSLEMAQEIASLGLASESITGGM